MKDSNKAGRVLLVNGKWEVVRTELEAWRDELLGATARSADILLKSELDTQSIHLAMGILGRAAQVDRVYIFEIHNGERDILLCSQVYEWCAEGVASQSDNPDLRNFPLIEAGFGRWVDELSADRPIFGDLTEFPEWERKVLEPRGIRSIAVVPVQRHGQLWGFIGFDDCTHWHKWTSGTISCLQVAARILSSALERLDFKRMSASNEASYRELVESVNGIVFRLSKAGRWTFLSPGWETHLGWTLSASLDQRAIRFVSKEDRRNLFAAWKRVWQVTSVPIRFEVRFERADGTVRWMLVTTRVVNDNSENGGFVAGVLTDISYGKKIEAELIAARIAAESANRAKSEFLSTMSHELRTPLNAVIGLSESLIEIGASFDADRTKRYLEIIQRSGRHLLAQIDDILELVRIEAGKSQFNPTPFDLTSLLSSLAERIQPEARAKSLNIVIQQAVTPVVVNADERLLRKMLQNLLSNAIKFTPPNGRIELRLEVQPEGQVTLAVRDTGIGIPTEKQDLLFKAFSQLDASLERRFGGTGLGLVLVHRMATLHGATVKVESMVGKGSTFSITLPSKVARLTTGKIRPTAPVLLVDDDHTHHILVGDYLEKHGFEVIHCQRSEDALAELGKRAPCVAVVDINMPDINGVELIRLLRARPNGARLPILALSALSEVDDVSRSIAAGANQHLPKPVSLPGFLATVCQLADANL